METCAGGLPEKNFGPLIQFSDLWSSSMLDVFPSSCFLVAFVFLSLSAAEGRAGLPRGPNTDSYGDPLPAGVVIRVGTARLRQGPTGATTVVFSKDGQTL